MARASALNKTEGASAPTKSIKRGAAHLCIVDPLGRPVNGSEGKMAELFGTHPPMPTRIARLKMMGYEQSQHALASPPSSPAPA